MRNLAIVLWCILCVALACAMGGCGPMPDGDLDVNRRVKQKNSIQRTNRSMRRRSRTRTRVRPRTRVRTRTYR